MNYTDYRKGRSIGTSATSDIKCSSYSMAVKVLQADIYPEVGNEVKYYDSDSGFYQFAKVIKYKTPVSLIIQDLFNGRQYTYTLRKDGKFIVTRDKVFYNVFDIKYMKALKVEE